MTVDRLSDFRDALQAAQPEYRQLLDAASSADDLQGWVTVGAFVAIGAIIMLLFVADSAKARRGKAAFIAIFALAAASIAGIAWSSSLKLDALNACEAYVPDVAYSSEIASVENAYKAGAERVLITTVTGDKIYAMAGRAIDGYIEPGMHIEIAPADALGRKNVIESRLETSGSIVDLDRDNIDRCLDDNEAVLVYDDSARIPELN